MGTITHFSFTVDSFEGEEDFKERLENFIFGKTGEEVKVDVSHDLKD